MIPQRNISLIANKITTAAGQRIPETVIERDYVLAWFLSGLAGHGLRDRLAFKGGTALRRERLSQQVSDLPSYGHVFRDVRRALRTASLKR